MEADMIDPAARPPAAEGVDMELARLLVTAEAGLEDAVNFWGVQDDVPTDAQMRKSGMEGLRAIRSAIQMLTDRVHARPAPPITAAERAALDRLETEAMFAWGDPADDPLLADITVLLALARRARSAEHGNE